MHDKYDKCGVWVIDFSKTNPIQDGCEISHRLPWQIGNHEDGFLFGLDNLMQVSTF
jgi:1D-myo-inositol-triphosphate 3-kinase